MLALCNTMISQNRLIPVKLFTPYKQAGNEWQNFIVKHIGTLWGFRWSTRMLRRVIQGHLRGVIHYWITNKLWLSALAPDPRPTPIFLLGRSTERHGPFELKSITDWSYTWSQVYINLHRFYIKITIQIYLRVVYS